jgi:FkbM family methyltransferase
MALAKLLKRYVFKLPNYVRTFRLAPGLRLLLQVETGMVHNGRKVKRFSVPGYPPVTLRNSVSDRATFWQCIVTRQYRLDGIQQASAIDRRYTDILSRGKRPLIIDAGANIGLSTLFFSRIYPKARIICVEPERNNLELLAANTASLGDAVHIAAGAVWDTDEPLAIRDPRAGSSEMQVVGSNNARGQQVPVHTINGDLCETPCGLGSGLIRFGW